MSMFVFEWKDNDAKSLKFELKGMEIMPSIILLYFSILWKRCWAHKKKRKPWVKVLELQQKKLVEVVPVFGDV